jgi:hypothetical protein
MAPEQLQGRVRYSSDQYSLAVTAYEWLCGERPFNGSFTEIASQHVLVPPSSLRDRVPDLPPAVEQVVFKALAKDPTKRFETVLAFAHALQQAAQLPSQPYSPHSSQLAPSATFIQPAPSTSHLENNDDFHTVPMTNNFTESFAPAPPTLKYPPSPLPPTSTPPSPFTSLPTQQMPVNAFSDEQLFTPYTLSQPLSTQRPASQHLPTPYTSTQQPPSTPYPPDRYITPTHEAPTKQRSFPLWQILTMGAILLLLLTVGLTFVNLHRQHSFQTNAQTLQPTGPNTAPGNTFPTLPPQGGNGIAKPAPSNCLDTAPNHLEFTSSLSQNTTPAHSVYLHCKDATNPVRIVIKTVDGSNWLIARHSTTSTDSTISDTVRIFIGKNNMQPGLYNAILIITQGNSTAIIKVSYTISK